MSLKVAKDAAHKVSKDISAEIEEVHGGYWEKRYDIAKVLITLTSSMLVVEITFYNSIIDSFTNVTSPIIMVLSWCATLFSLLFAISCLRATMKISAHRLQLFYALHLSTKESFSAKFQKKELSESIVKNAYETSQKVFHQIMEHDKGANRTITASIYSLAIALVFLMAFGVTNIDISKEKQSNKSMNQTENTSAT